MNMAHVADGMVVNVTSLVDSEVNDDPATGEAFCAALFGGAWVHSPDDQPACIGFGYDPATGFEQQPPFTPSA